MGETGHLFGSFPSPESQKPDWSFTPKKKNVITKSEADQKRISLGRVLNRASTDPKIIGQVVVCTHVVTAVGTPFGP